MDLYEAISRTNTNKDTVLLTVIYGEALGEKVLLSEGSTVWMSDEDGFFKSHLDEVKAAEVNSTTEIEGQIVVSERIGSEKKIVICGGGHVAMPVISIAKMIDLRVTVIEDREEFAENARAQGADEVICAGFADALGKIESDGDTFFVVVTRGHRYDFECLREVMKKPRAYSGMIGSRRHVDVVMKALREEGFPEEELREVHSPIGLAIGAETPAEIAVSIMAEIIEVKNRKDRSSGFTGKLMRQILSAERGTAVLATIVNLEGSAPRGTGSRMLVGSEGLLAGTIGGGSLEAAVIEEAEAMLGSGEDIEIMHVDLAVANTAEDEGMVCGGVVDVMLEII